MPSPYFTAILSGTTTSTPGFTIDRPAPQLAILVPSGTTGELRVEYGTASGGVYGALTRGDGSGAPCGIAETPDGRHILLDALPRAGGGVGFALAAHGRVVPSRDRVAFRAHWPNCRGVHPSLLRSAVR